VTSTGHLADQYWFVLPPRQSWYHEEYSPLALPLRYSATSRS